jgi:hypothetical protein
MWCSRRPGLSRQRTKASREFSESGQDRVAEASARGDVTLTAVGRGT